MCAGKHRTRICRMEKEEEDIGRSSASSNINKWKEKAQAKCGKGIERRSRR
eukprot:TRINITY_DN2398_c1_g1_i1.p2 TRINITY_DN2398_c1_g1~~TRINITY_DN2398_c1_g1_i1.p2  ORF type:complete len:51 (+),score=11.56 TRINITY_DN2398_c1_g1_i1:60-212(+)